MKQFSEETRRRMAESAKKRCADPKWIEAQHRQKKGLDDMKIKLDPGAYMPEKAHATDAGYDLRAPQDCIVDAHGCATIDTGVHIELPSGTVGFLKSKSGLNVNHGITSEGVIDEGYTGSIRVKLYNRSPIRYYFEKGDKISQLVILPYLSPDLELVDELEATERGNNGFGSTGK